jgi:hypothetical protein
MGSGVCGRGVGAGESAFEVLPRLLEVDSGGSRMIEGNWSVGFLLFNDISGLEASLG